MASAWEKLTGGLCNNDKPLHIKRGKKQTAAAFKAVHLNKKKKAKVQRKREFEQTDKACSMRSSELWDKREANASGAFWNAKNSAPGVCTVTKY